MTNTLRKPHRRTTLESKTDTRVKFFGRSRKVGDQIRYTFGFNTNDSHRSLVDIVYLGNEEGLVSLPGKVNVHPLRNPKTHGYEKYIKGLGEGILQNEMLLVSLGTLLAIGYKGVKLNPRTGIHKEINFSDTRNFNTLRVLSDYLIRPDLPATITNAFPIQIDTAQIVELYKMYRKDLPIDWRT